MVRNKNGNAADNKGNVIERKINEKPPITLEPDKPNNSQNNHARSNKGRSATAITFSKYVNSIPELSNIWNSAKVKGTTPFNKLVKHNLKSIDYNLLTVYNIITPSVCQFNDITLKSNEIAFDSKILNLNLTLSSRTDLHEEGLLIAVMAFQNPKKSNEAQVVLNHISQPIVSLVNQAPFDVMLQLNDSQKQLRDKYQNCIIYLTVIFDSPNFKETIYTHTNSKSFVCN